MHSTPDNFNLGENRNNITQFLNEQQELINSESFILDCTPYVSENLNTPLGNNNTEGINHSSIAMQNVLEGINFQPSKQKEFINSESSMLPISLDNTPDFPESFDTPHGNNNFEGINQSPSLHNNLITTETGSTHSIF